MSVRVRFLSLVPFCLGVAMLACSFGSAAPGAPAASSTQGNSPAASVPAASVPPPSGDARQALIDAFTKLDHGYPYRLTETDSAGSCTQMVRKVEFASKDEWHATWRGCQTGEAISTGGKSYYFINGSWTAGENPLGTQQQVNVAALIVAGLQNVQAAGSESLNGVQNYVYTFDLKDPVFNVTGGKAWIGAADGLPHQVQAQYTMSGTPGNTQLVYEYGVTVSIKAPIP